MLKLRAKIFMINLFYLSACNNPLTQFSRPLINMKNQTRIWLRKSYKLLETNSNFETISQEFWINTEFGKKNWPELQWTLAVLG